MFGCVDRFDGSNHGSRRAERAELQGLLMTQSDVMIQADYINIVSLVV
jgi:hypothetical protein